MRILLSCVQCHIGGVPAWMLAMHDALAARGHEVILYFFAGGNFEEALVARARVVVGDLARLLRLVREERIDVVHAMHYDWEHGVQCVRLPSLEVPVLVTLHGQAVPIWTSKTCDGIVACSAWQARAMQRLTDLPVRTILNGIDTERFQPAPAEADGPPVIAWIGRADSLNSKRIDRLVPLAPLLRERGYRLWVASPVSLDELASSSAEGRAIADGLCGQIDRWQSVPAEAMPRFLRAVAATGGAVLSTSASEGLPLTLLEAQACGVPVLATDVRGNNEAVLAASGGVLYDEAEPAASLAERIVGFVTDTTDWRRRSEAARATVLERFSLERMVSDYLASYQALPDRPCRSSVPPRHYLGVCRGTERTDHARLAESCWRASKELAEEDQSLARRLAAAGLRAAPLHLVRRVGALRAARQVSRPTGEACTET